jgi:hypothetical protein
MARGQNSRARRGGCDRGRGSAAIAGPRVVMRSWRPAPPAPLPAARRGGRAGRGPRPRSRRSTTSKPSSSRQARRLISSAQPVTASGSIASRSYCPRPSPWPRSWIVLCARSSDGERIDGIGLLRLTILGPSSRVAAARRRRAGRRAIWPGAASSFRNYTQSAPLATQPACRGWRRRRSRRWSADDALAAAVLVSRRR